MTSLPKNDDGDMTFWDHLDVLRGVIIKMLLAAMAAGLLAFLFKDQVFSIVLAPHDSHFVTYRLIGATDFHIKLINTGLTEQFLIHLKVAFFVGLLVASPYLVYLLYGFIAPALYPQEKSCVVRVVVSGYVLFFLGVAVDYFVIFPFTVRFLGTYSVSSQVENMLSIQSYIDTLLTMSFVFGIIFELPVVSWMLAKFGLLKADWMRRYRRHAVVVILILSAFITPTSDAFTLLLVSLPVWLLYEFSIAIVALTDKNAIVEKDK